jgi:hypothetical protein
MPADIEFHQDYPCGKTPTKNGKQGTHKYGGVIDYC